MSFKYTILDELLILSLLIETIDLFYGCEALRLWCSVITATNVID